MDCHSISIKRLFIFPLDFFVSATVFYIFCKVLLKYPTSHYNLMFRTWLQRRRFHSREKISLFNVHNETVQQIKNSEALGPKDQNALFFSFANSNFKSLDLIDSRKSMISGISPISLSQFFTETVAAVGIKTVELSKSSFEGLCVSWVEWHHLLFYWRWLFWGFSSFAWKWWKSLSLSPGSQALILTLFVSDAL